MYTWLDSDDAGYSSRPVPAQRPQSRPVRPASVSFGDLTMRFSRRKRRAEFSVNGTVGEHALDGLTDFLNGVAGHGVTVVTVDVKGLEPSVADACLGTLRQFAQQLKADGAELVVVGAQL